MKTLKNNNGMALVTVLFLIVIFALVGTLILNFTVSNAKQTKNIEEDMIAVDAAEMGIVKYRNELLTKMDTVLSADIKAAIERIDAENIARAQRNAAKKSNQTLEEYIEVNATNVIAEMKKDPNFSNPNRFLLGYNVGQTFEVFPGSSETFTIKEVKVNTSSPDFPQKIKFEVESVGKSLQDENEITADFEFDLAFIIGEHVQSDGVVKVEKSNELPFLWNNDAVELPLGSKNCDHLFDAVKSLSDQCIYSPKASNAYYINSHIEDINSYIKENLWTNNRDDLRLINSNLYVEGNVSGSTISNFSNSNIQAEGNINFSNMNGSGVFENIQMKAKEVGIFGTTSGNISLGNITGNGIVNSKLHAEGELSIGEINQGGIINSEISSKGIMNFKNLNKGIKESYVYAKDNLNFDNFNSGANIENSIIRTDDILNFQNINSIIDEGTLIYAGKRINLGYAGNNANMNGSIHANAFVCSGGNIAGRIKDKASNIQPITINGKTITSNVVEGVTFDQCLALAGKSYTQDEVKTSNLGSIFDSIKSSVDTADYTYN